MTTRTPFHSTQYNNTARGPTPCQLSLVIDSLPLLLPLILLPLHLRWSGGYPPAHSYFLITRRWRAASTICCYLYPNWGFFSSAFPKNFVVKHETHRRIHDTIDSFTCSVSFFQLRLDTLPNWQVVLLLLPFESDQGRGGNGNHLTQREH